MKSKIKFNLYKNLFCYWVVSLVMISFFVNTTAKADVSMLKQGVNYYRKAQYKDAAIVFHKITNLENTSEDIKTRAQYYLGLSLFNLKLYQASSYPIINAIRSNSKKFRQKSLEKLIAISNKLGDQQMLDLALTKMLVTDLEKLAIDVYYFKLGSVNYEKNKLDQAVNFLNLSLTKNPNSEQALNLLALSYLKKNDEEKAIETYNKLLSRYDSVSNSNTKKGYALLNSARAYFQAKKYELAVDTYRKISKDNFVYRESLTELSWAYLNLGKIRSALGVLQTLHTPYYENYSDPESLVLRAILHNYNCQFDDAELVVKTFDENYNNVIEILNNWTSQKTSSADALAEISYATETLKTINKDHKSGLELAKSYNGKIPFKVIRTILKDSRVNNLFDTYSIVKNESKMAKKYFGSSQTGLRPFLDKIYEGRLDFYKNQLATTFKQSVINLEKSISYFKQQMLFVNYEILESKKGQMRLKAIAEDSQLDVKDTNPETKQEAKVENQDEDQKDESEDQTASNPVIKPEASIKENFSRSYYVNKGLRFWPFQGEVWKDEIIGYQYSGESRCVQK